MTIVVPIKDLDTRKLAGPGLRTFFNIAEAWQLTREEQMRLLGVPATSTYHHWKSGHGTKLSPDTLERISYILGIYKALQILLPDPHAADGWVKKPNAAIPFGGRSALTYMMQGHVRNLYEVRLYLDAQRGV